MFDPNRPPVQPIPAASVILVRPKDGSLEVFLLRRSRKSSFMPTAFVFPGGKVDPDDGSSEVAAIRELFEEAGILLVDGPMPAEDQLAEWRRRLNAGEATFQAFLSEENLTPARDRLRWWARWVTPSAEPKRFDAQFYLAELPAGQIPSFDQKETVEELWLTPAEAMARHARAELSLPPPQLRTLLDLQGKDLNAAVGAAAERARHPHPITPRFAMIGETVALLLPWDPEYETAGQGEGPPTPANHFLASGPTRFLLENMTWRMA